VQEDVHTFVRQRIELHDLSAFWRVDLSPADVRKPTEIFLVNSVSGDARLALHRVGNSEALCSISGDPGANLGALVGPARRRRGLTSKDSRIEGHVRGQ